MPSTFSPRFPCVHGPAPRDERAGPPPAAEVVEEVRRRLALIGWVASALGVAIVFNSIGFLMPIFTDPDDRYELALLNAPLIVVFLIGSGIAVRRRTESRLARAVAWIVEGRPPSDEEHRWTLGLAAHAVKLSAVAWVVAGMFFSILAAVTHSWELALIVAATSWLGGETTCALMYLASERALRPITARALGARLPTGTVAPGVGGRLLGAWSLGTGVPLFGVLVVAVVGLTEPGVETEYVAAAILFLGVVAASAGLLAILFAAKAIAHPVISVRRGLERVERGDLEADLPVDDASEVGLLQAGFNRMVDVMRERERIRDLFGRQVGEDVAQAALRGGARLGGEERLIGALYVDIVGSTSMAMALPPTEVVAVLNRFFRVVVEAIEAECGWVNKFEGDGALCVFGAPVPRDDPASDALRAARSLAARLSREVPEVEFGIGVSAGTAVAGNVGAERRFEYTVIGDPVNEAARLSALAKGRSERVLASDAALRRAAEVETSAWTVSNSAMLRGRRVATQLAHPRELAAR